MSTVWKSPSSQSARVSLPVPRNVWPHWMPRGPEVVSLEEGRARLIRLESAALEALRVMPSPDASSEVLKLRELVISCKRKSVDQTTRMRRACPL